MNDMRYFQLSELWGWISPEVNLAGFNESVSRCSIGFLPSLPIKF